jgi:hypothetical protein
MRNPLRCKGEGLDDSLTLTGTHLTNDGEARETEDARVLPPAIIEA